MAAKIKLKRETGGTGDTPTTSDIEAYEIAQNVTDKRLFGRDGSNNIFEFGINPTSIATGAITATGTVTANSQLASSNAVLTGGSVNGIVIGASTAAAITGTLITANTNFAGNITGNVTGNVTGNITGNTTGNLTGNVTAGSGTSTFNNLVINGTVDFNTAVLTDLGSPSNSTDAATKGYVDTEITNLIGGAPGALDTLNELAAALNDDASFNSTITTSIATKLPLAGGTMSGAIAMGSNKVTGLTNGSASGDAVNKGQLDTMLPLAGGTMTGNIAIGSNVITSSSNPTDDTHLARKAYVDSQLGSATAAATSAAAAATSATASASSATGAASSATSAASSATSAAASLDSFDDRYLGSKSSSPSVDNDGDALVTGALYYDSSAEEMRVYTGSAWKAAGSAINGTSSRQTYTATSNQTTFAITYDVGFVDVYLNGIKLLVGTDVTATSGTNVVLATGAATGDIVDLVAYGAFSVSDTYTQAASNARFAQLSNNLSDLASAATALTNLGITSTAAELNIMDGVTSTAAELNILDGVTSTAAELNILDGVTSTAAELNILDGVTSTAAELNILDGVTSTAAELNLVDGSSAGTIVNSKGVVYGSSGEVNATTLQIAGTSITSTAAELNILDGVTSSTAELNILDGVTATATEINKLDALSRGSILYGNSSAETAILTKGSADQVLTSDGTDIAWADVSSGGGGFGNSVAITSSQTWQVPADVTLIKITVTGGGGGATNGYSCAGAAGGTAIKYITVVAGNNVVITIGAGGAGATSAGTTGGTTTAVYNSAVTVSATGGTGGYSYVRAGGAGSGGDININGGVASAGNTYESGQSSFWGGGHSASHGTGAYGAGGSFYLYYSTYGSAGKDGVVYIEY
mgnify:CR=1 FL=1|tara:strand:+ start:1841 stop:4462 length:2622 start_codon:yes stop_codon:yes gene_type:complete